MKQTGGRGMVGLRVWVVLQFWQYLNYTASMVGSLMEDEL
jgi:hypothetical protein